MSATFIAFAPTLIFWSAVNLKEIPVAFFLCVALLGYSRLMQKITIRNFVLVISCLMVLVVLRVYVALILSLVFLVSWLLGRYSLNRRFKGGLIIIVLLISLWILVGRTSPVDLFLNQAVGWMQGGLSGLSASDFESAGERGLFMGQLGLGSSSAWLVNVAHFFVTPSPYRLRFTLAGILNIGTVFWYVLFPYFIFGTYYSVRRRAKVMLPIVLFVYGVIIAYAPFATRSGARHRAQLMPFVFLIAAIGVSNFQCRHKKVLTYLIWTGLFIGITLVEMFY